MADPDSDSNPDSDNDIESGIPVQGSAIATNHTEAEAPRGTQRHTEAPRQRQAEPEAEAPRNTGRNSQNLTQAEAETDRNNQRQTQAEADRGTQKQEKVILKNEPPPPRVTKDVKPIPVNISERMKSGETTLEEKPKEEPASLANAKQTLNEKFRGYQAHSPNTVQLPGGGWGTIVQNERGGFSVVPVEAPQIEADDEFEAAVNEITRQELKVNTLAIMKKVAFTPSTVMGYAFVSSKTAEDGTPYFVGDIGDFVNDCIRFTLKFGFGVEFAITSGRRTLADVFKGVEANA